MSDERVIKIAEQEEGYYGFQVKIQEEGIELQYTDGNLVEEWFQIEIRDLPKLIEVLNAVKEIGF